MDDDIKMSGRCFWREGSKWMPATVTKAIYRPGEGRFAADYQYGGVRGRLEVTGKAGELSGTWDEGTWKGNTRLVHTCGGQKHVFIGTWQGEGGPGEFVFDLDEDDG
jgi:hypothetical protein